MLCDFHVHTDFSADSKTPIRDQIEAAIRLGMKEICITDHHDYGTSGMCHLDYTVDPVTYFAALKDLAEEYREKLSADCKLFTYIQFLFFKQWRALREYVHSNYRIGKLYISQHLSTPPMWIYNP